MLRLIVSVLRQEKRERLLIQLLERGNRIVYTQRHGNIYSQNNKNAKYSTTRIKKEGKQRLAAKLKQFEGTEMAGSFFDCGKSILPVEASG